MNPRRQSLLTNLFDEKIDKKTNTNIVKKQNSLILIELN
jgi:hypothetical protein